LNTENDSPLTVLLERTEKLEARSLVGVKSWYVDTQYLVSTDEFEFTAAAGDPPLRPSELDLRRVTLVLNGQPILIGQIEITSIGSDGSAVTCRGRDFMADLLECNVDPTFKLRDDMTLEQMLLEVCSPLGISKIVDDADDYDADKSIRDIRTGLTPDRKGRKRHARRSDPLKDYQPKPGEGIYEYINRICARMGLTLQPGPDRQTLFITAPFYDQSSVYEPIRRYRDASLNTGNNCLGATAVRDFTRMPTVAQATGTAATAGKAGVSLFKEVDVFGLGGAEELAAVIQDRAHAGRFKPSSALTGEELDARATRAYRLLYLRDEACRTDEQLDHAIRRAVAERLKDSLRYTCTVAGHKDLTTDALWAVDQTVNVEDEICDIREALWIAKRTFRFDRDSGSTTQLECWRPGSFPFIDETETA
jgi:prophage tail gpP-like protein